MKIALLRVGIDSGSGGMHGPLFHDGSFEFVPIPDRSGIDERTYGNHVGRKGRKLIRYFPAARRRRMVSQCMHVDPEFTTFTYGDPGAPKAGLRHLEPGDLLVFYCGLQGWGFPSEPALYLMGYFEVLIAGKAAEMQPEVVQSLFGENFHVRHRNVYERQKCNLVLVKGTEQSRLLQTAVPISAVGRDRRGRPLKVLSPEMQQIFGDFNGKISIQRSPPRWVAPHHTARAADFIRSLQ